MDELPDVDDLPLAAWERAGGPVPRLQPQLFSEAWLMGHEDPAVWDFEDEFTLAWDSFYDDPDFLQWFQEHWPRLREDGESNTIVFEEREDVGWRRSRRGTVMLVPAHEVRTSADRMSYFREVIRRFMKRASSRAGINPPPGWG